MDKRYFPGVNKISTALFVLFYFQTIVSRAAIVNINSAINVDAGIKEKNLSDTSIIVISGTIKDDNGNPLENAEILFDTTVVAVTGKDGKFSFEPTAITPSIHNIYFSRDSFATVVRTYYPVMLSANYNVTLYRQMGVTKIKQISNEPVLVKNEDSVQVINTKPLPVSKIDSVHAISKDSSGATPHIVSKDSVIGKSVIVVAELDFPSILFKTNATALTAQSKAFLDIVSEKLKANPAVKIDIKANIPEHDYNPTIAQKRLANIVKYLVANGIATDRLNKVTVMGGGELNTIDLVNSKE